LARTVDPATTPYFFLSCGNQEGLLASNRQFAALLQRRHFRYEFTSWPAGTTGLSSIAPFRFFRAVRPNTSIPRADATARRNPYVMLRNVNILLASDHAGFDLKQILLPYVEALGHTVRDVGVFDKTPSDYPDIAETLCLEILAGQGDRGILICGSGIGVGVAANKIPGIRAGLCAECYSAHQGVEHDNINVMVLGERSIGVELAKDLVRIFLDARFTAEERHVRRLAKIRKLEEKYSAARTITAP
jgi:ribose 5-phosphate isomerase B